ncbi:four-carbon acid sugar kinase family protein [Actinopolymorpha sp. NPDC004070]|uniref:four-carbon acid sugar kinase family protein n=1 Tax=Actinopolymorpha sp. NPDC004070 TaxID=3154548 RepID=UPI0033BCB494
MADPTPGPTRGLRVAVVADDLTGAADTGAGFLRARMTTTVTWAEELLAGGVTESSHGHTDVLAIDAGTRRVAAGRAASTTGRVVEALRVAGTRVLYQKVDSMARGHLGTEVAAALRAWHPDAVAVVAPAFPAAGRSTVGGVQRVHGVPAEGGDLAVRLEGAGVRTGRVGLAAVRSTDPRTVLERSLRSGVRALLCDAETDADLAAIAGAAAALARPVVWVGSAGLAHLLPTALELTDVHDADGTDPADKPGLTGPGKDGLTVDPELSGYGRDVHPAGPVLVAVGSVHASAREQAHHLLADGAGHVEVPVPTLDYHVEVTLAAIRRHLHAGTDVVLTLADDLGAAGPDDHRLTARLGELTRPCADLVAGLVLTGGDTATGLLRAWGVPGLRLYAEVEPGVPLSVTTGPRRLPVVTKAGAFGDPATLRRARARLAAFTASHVPSSTHSSAHSPSAEGER